MVADMFADIVAKKGTQFGKKKKKGTQFGKKKRKGTQFGERVGHGGWLIGPKLFLPEAYPTCVSSKLYEFIQVATDRTILKFDALPIAHFEADVPNSSKHL